MKFKGQLLTAPRSEIVAFPRDQIIGSQVVHNDIIFVITAILDYTEFEALCPEPRPLPTLEQGGKRGFATDAPDYKARLVEWYEKKTNWVFLKSIESTPDFEWEKVNLKDPKTWDLWREELKESHFTPMECQHLLNRAIRVNSIDEDKMEEARNRFLALKSQSEKA